jgi:hypothetical protein
MDEGMDMGGNGDEDEKKTRKKHLPALFSV